MSKPQNEPTVTVSKDGPYLVKGGVPLAKQTIVADREGDSQDWRESEPSRRRTVRAVSLRPFGKTSRSATAATSRSASMARRRASRARPTASRRGRSWARRMTLTDAEPLCAFARFCDRDGQGVEYQVGAPTSPR